MKLKTGLGTLVEFGRTWTRYEQLRRRLIWRAELDPDFAAVMAIEGQMRRSEVRVLYELAQQVAVGTCIVEIGSYHGLSTAALARGSAQGASAPVYAIDSHEYLDPGTYSESAGMLYAGNDGAVFMRYMLASNVAPMVRVINLFSNEAVQGWHRPIGLLWLDGNHEYDAVRRDFDEWSPFVVEGGWIALHDAHHPEAGPYRVVEEKLAQGGYELVRSVEKLTVLAKRAQSSSTNAVKESARDG